MDNDGNIGLQPSDETVYGTEENTMVMSEKVKYHYSRFFSSFEKVHSLMTFTLLCIEEKLSIFLLLCVGFAFGIFWNK